MTGPSRLHISGGSHRATFGAMGVVWALLDTDQWSDVETVVTVSGGSVLSGAIVGADDPQAVEERLRRAFDAGLRGAGPPWRTPAGLLLALAPVVAFAFWIASLAMLIGPASSAVGAAVVALFGPVAIITIGRNALARYWRRYVTTIVSTDRRLDSLADSSRQHVFCATGLSSGAPHYLWAGGTRLVGSEGIRWGVPIQRDFTVVDAVCASTSLPGLGRTWLRGEADSLPGGEYLVDGGVSGTLGHQLIDRVDHRPGAARRSGADVLVIDASRHPRPPGPARRHVGRVSLIAALISWLNTSFEATYVNDLLDVPPSRLIRLAEEPLKSGPEPDLSALPASVRQRVTAATAHVDVERGLRVLRDRSGNVGLLSLDRASALLLVTTGYLSGLSAVAADQVRGDALLASLARLEERLDAQGELTALWHEASA